MYQTAPVNVSAMVVIPNPSDNSQNPPAVAVQIQNNTQYQLTNNLTADIAQPNSALTIEIPIGFTPLILFPINFTTAVGTISTEWLEYSENPTVPDGSLQPSQALPLPWKYVGDFSPGTASTQIPVTPSCTGLIVTSSVPLLSAQLYNIDFNSALFNLLINSIPNQSGNFVYWVGPIPNTLPTTHTNPAGPNQLGVQLNFSNSNVNYFAFEVAQPIDFLQLATVLQLVYGSVNTTGIVTPNTVANPGAGINWTYTFPGNARLTSVVATFVAGPAPANRNLSLYIQGGNLGVIPMCVMTITANGVAVTAGYSCASFFTPRSDNVVTFPIPDLYLASGSVVQGIASNIQAADAWTNIAVGTSPS